MSRSSLGLGPGDPVLSQNVVEDVAHSQWVFTIPKMLRPLFPQA